MARRLLRRLARAALRQGVRQGSLPWLFAGGLLALGARTPRREGAVLRVELAEGEGLVVEHRPR